MVDQLAGRGRRRPKYLTEQDVADRFGVHLRTVQRWVHDGRFDNVLRVSTKLVRIPYESVLAFETKHDTNT